MEPQVPSTSQEEMKLTELSSRMNIIDRDKYAANKLIAINFKEINFQIGTSSPCCEYCNKCSFCNWFSVLK